MWHLLVPLLLLFESLSYFCHFVGHILWFPQNVWKGGNKTESQIDIFPKDYIPTDLSPAVPKLRAARCKRWTSIDPVNLSSSVWRSCTAAKACCWSKQGDLASAAVVNHRRMVVTNIMIVVFTTFTCNIGVFNIIVIQSHRFMIHFTLAMFSSVEYTIFHCAPNYFVLEKYLLLKRGYFYESSTYKGRWNKNLTLKSKVLDSKDWTILWVLNFCVSRCLSQCKSNQFN